MCGWDDHDSVTSYKGGCSRDSGEDAQRRTNDAIRLAIRCVSCAICAWAKRGMRRTLYCLRMVIVTEVAGDKCYCNGAVSRSP